MRTGQIADDCREGLRDFPHEGEVQGVGGVRGLVVVGIAEGRSVFRLLRIPEHPLVRQIGQPLRQSSATWRWFPHLHTLRHSSRKPPPERL